MVSKTEIWTYLGQPDIWDVWDISCPFQFFVKLNKHGHYIVSLVKPKRKENITVYKCKATWYEQTEVNNSHFKLIAILTRQYCILLYGWLCEWARWTKSCALIGYPSGQDGAPSSLNRASFSEAGPSRFSFVISAKVRFERRKLQIFRFFFSIDGVGKLIAPKRVKTKKTTMLMSFVKNS